MASAKRYNKVHQGKIILFYVGTISEKELTVLLKEKLPRYMIPNYVEQLEEMPFTANGKINRVELKNRYQTAKK